MYTWIIFISLLINRCGCMREIDFHEQTVIEKFINELKPVNSEWSREACTCDDGPTDAYG